jgi:putative Holliday junction resolvase
MSRIVAIDYGSKRCGIAATDPLQLIASGLDTVNRGELLQFLEAYLKKEEVECLVIGLPLRLNNELSAVESDIQKLIEQLKKKYPQLRIEREDERFTSKLAFDSMLKGGVKKKKRRDKALIDKVSATIILQSYMERRSL